MQKKKTKNNSQTYWNKRARLDKIKTIKTAEAGIDSLKKLLKKNLDSVDKQIKNFYDRYGNNPAEKLSYDEWQKYKEKLKIKAKMNPKDKRLQRLAKQNIPKYRIDRLRALQIDLQILLAETTKGQEAGIYKTLKDVAKISQNTTALRYKDTLGVNFNKIANKQIEKIINTDWVGDKNWNERLWGDSAKVGKKISNILDEGIPQGKSMQEMAHELEDATHQSFNNCFRLIRTESARVNSDVLIDSFKQAQEELGYTKYRYDAFLDNRTSEICRNLDGKLFDINDAEIGVNFPPMHPNCRSTCVLDESNIEL